jgi:hypothetical protein
MRRPDWHRRSAPRRSAAPRRLARLALLLPLLLHQPQEALHAALDEEHLAGHAASSHAAASAGKLHGHAGDGHDSGPEHPEICDFCLLFGSALAPPGAAARPEPDWQTPAARSAVEAIRRQTPVRVGHPVRAPPRSI